MIAAAPCSSNSEASPNSGNRTRGTVSPGCGKELLHQSLLVLPQGFELPPLCLDHVVERAETVGDLLLLWTRWKLKPGRLLKAVLT